MTVLESMAKSVIRGVPVQHTPAEMDKRIVTKRNLTAVGAKRIGTSSTVIAAFDGGLIPDYAFYGPAVMRCSLYRKHFGVGKICAKVCDLCPTPKARMCSDCGANNPGEGQAKVCTPKCKLCEEKHPMGRKGSVFKVP